MRALVPFRYAVKIIDGVPEPDYVFQLDSHLHSCIGFYRSNTRRYVNEAGVAIQAAAEKKGIKIK